jgi:UDP-N-acetylmuramate dehydrogenase
MTGQGLTVREQVPLAPYTTFGVGGTARWLAEIASPAELAEAVGWAKQRGLPLFVLGGGSNLLVRDEGFAGLVLRMQIGGTEYRGDGVFAVGAGVVWDSFVESAVGRGFAGIECLAGIPGSVGGTPVQNVGAYGQEVAETIVRVHAFDRETEQFVEFDREGCRFRYRESRFNTDEPGRYVVHQVEFKLVEDGSPRLAYADLQGRFARATRPPTLTETAAAVREIRRSKGMLLMEGEANCRSAGSFFKNPVVREEVFAGVVAAARGVDVPHWPAGEGRVKIPAAWLLEQAGFVKGFGTGPVGISTQHTLALVNRGGARFADVERMQSEIVAAVKERFGVELVREPVVLG